MKSLETEMVRQLQMEDLQEQHRQIAEAVGIEGLVRLTEYFGGSGIYIPQKRELLKNKVYNSIYSEFDGTNIKALAVAYGVSESTVYNVVREKILKGSAKHQLEGQISFADFGN